MSGYNTLNVVLECPHCTCIGLVSVEFRFGLFEFREYEVGDRLEWGAKGDRYPRQRPDGGDYQGEGYVECPFCGRDYWVIVNVGSDVIRSVAVNRSKPGYISASDGG